MIPKQPSYMGVSKNQGAEQNPKWEGSCYKAPSRMTPQFIEAAICRTLDRGSCLSPTVSAQLRLNEYDAISAAQIPEDILPRSPQGQLYS